MLSRRLLPSIALGLSLATHAAPPSRTWEFNLKAPGTYEVHVQHAIKGTTVPPGAEATYAFQTREGTIKRDLSFSFYDGHPVVVLIADIPSPQKASVIISGLPPPLLQQTRIYVIEQNSRYPYEWLDPDKSLDLKSAQRLRDILKQPKQSIDLAKAKLTIDQQIDPTIDVEANLQKLDAMVARIRTMPGFNVTSTAKLQALKRHLYEPGAWNDYQPYHYDLDDPLGSKIRNKLLSHYLASKKGNCVTMPLLFIILGQRLGLDVTAATAPLHVLVKFKDETGTTYNLEATSGANPTRNVWYRQQLPMTDEAIANGVYLRPLTKKETVALMAETLTELYVDQNEFEKVITLSDLILEYYPKNVTVMIRKSNAYYDLMQKYYVQKYRSPDDISDRAKGHYLYLSQNNRFWASKAQALGWQEWKREDDEKYLQAIKEAKSKTLNRIY